MSKKLVAWLWVLFATVMAFGSAQIAYAQVEIDDTTNVTPSTAQPWPTGPYSQVLPNFGVMQTSIPLFSIPGPGNTELSFSLYNRTIQTWSTSYTATDAGAGVGWSTSAVSECVTGTTTGVQVLENMGGNSTNQWQSDGNPTPTYSRYPGTRADLVQTQSGSTMTGFVVTDHPSNSVYTYNQSVVMNSQYHYRISQMADSHGNTVTTSYDSNNRPSRVTDAVGRYYTIQYDDYGQVQSVTLYADTPKTWTFNYQRNVSGYNCELLTSITLPSNRAISFGYDGVSNSDPINISSLTDANENTWKYSYSVMCPSNNPNEYGLSGVTDPNVNSTSFSYSVQIKYTYTTLPDGTVVQSGATIVKRRLELTHLAA
jgi:YD repeat-containing protein